MRILGRRTKLVVFGFLMFLLGYFTVNIIHTNLPLITADKPPPKPPNPPPPENIRPVAINPEQHEIEAPLLIDKIDETDKKRIDKDEIAFNQNNSVLVIQDDKRKKKRYLAFDGGGLGSVNTGVVRCESSGLEVEITNSQERWNEADIFYFHMSAPNQRPNPNGYVMVYTMESEVLLFTILINIFALFHQLKYYLSLFLCISLFLMFLALSNDRYSVKTNFYT